MLFFPFEVAHLSHVVDTFTPLPPSDSSLMSFDYDKIIETNEASAIVSSSFLSILSVNVCSLFTAATIFGFINFHFLS